MADGGHHDVLAATPWFSPLLAVGSSSITAIVIWAGQRLIGKAAWQAAITAANKDLIDQLQEERTSLRHDFDAYRAERAAEQVSWSSERAQMRGEIINLTQAFESMKANLRRRGIEIPEGTYHPPGEMTVIEGGNK